MFLPSKFLSSWTGVFQCVPALSVSPPSSLLSLPLSVLWIYRLYGNTLHSCFISVLLYREWWFSSFGNRSTAPSLGTRTSDSGHSASWKCPSAKYCWNHIMMWTVREGPCDGVMFEIRSKEREGTNPSKGCVRVCTHVHQPMKTILQADETPFGQKALRKGRILS